MLPKGTVSFMVEVVEADGYTIKVWVSETVSVAPPVTTVALDLTTFQDEVTMQMAVNQIVQQASEDDGYGKMLDYRSEQAGYLKSLAESCGNMTLATLAAESSGKLEYLNNLVKMPIGEDPIADEPAGYGIKQRERYPPVTLQLPPFPAALGNRLASA